MDQDTAQCHLRPLPGTAVDKWLQLGPVLDPSWATADPLCAWLGAARWAPQQHYSAGARRGTSHSSLALPRPAPLQQDTWLQHHGHRVNTAGHWPCLSRGQGRWQGADEALGLRKVAQVPAQTSGDLMSKGRRTKLDLHVNTTLIPYSSCDHGEPHGQGGQGTSLLTM